MWGSKSKKILQMACALAGDLYRYTIMRYYICQRYDKP